MVNHNKLQLNNNVFVLFPRNKTNIDIGYVTVLSFSVTKR